MEALEGVAANLGAVPSLLKHTVGGLDITLGRLRCVGEVCLSTARAYGDHYTKVA